MHNQTYRNHMVAKPMVYIHIAGVCVQMVSNAALWLLLVLNFKFMFDLHLKCNTIKLERNMNMDISFYAMSFPPSSVTSNCTSLTDTFQFCTHCACHLHNTINQLAKCSMGHSLALHLISIWMCRGMCVCVFDDQMGVELKCYFMTIRLIFVRYTLCWTTT